MIFKKLLNNKVKEIAEQRKVLTETFPYTDWKKIPYTQYDKFLSLKDLIGECGVVWTNAFGRSNTEAEDTRKYLKDYSKHYEYVQDFNNWVGVGDGTCSVENNSVIVTNNEDSTGAYRARMYVSQYNNTEWKVYVSISDNATVHYIEFADARLTIFKTIPLKNGINTIPVLSEEELSQFNALYISVSPGASITITQIPNEVANERDIELFNFEWTDNCGYGEFRDNCLFDLHGSIDTFVDYTYSANTIHVTNIKTVGIKYLYVRNINSSAIGTTFKGRVRIEGIDSIRANDPTAFCQVAYSSYSASSPILGITGDGTFDWNYTKEDDSTTWITVLIYTSAEDLSTVSLYVEQIPVIDGCIVGDGIAAYGQCIKNFSLPTDYTVVAMRENPFNDTGTLIAKSINGSDAAFVFEHEIYVYSYGGPLKVTSFPELFSYQTKTSYNGTTITPGDKVDSDSVPLKIFNEQGSSEYVGTALYSFGIFTRTLTAEELALVEDCMYLELEYNTNILDNIEYYDILDARYRSNEEAEDKRNRWNGRLGKLHLTLNNYDYTGLSGWNCYSLPAFNKFNYASITNATESKCKIIKVDSNGWLTYMGVPSNLKKYGLKIKIHKSVTTRVGLLFLSSENTTVKNITLEEGLNIIPSNSIPEEYANVCFDLNSYSVGDYIEVEQLPLYPGALVSDGVDDNAISSEVIDEEIGGVVMMAEKISDPTTNYGNVFSSSVGLGGSSGKEIAGLISKAGDYIILGDPWTSIAKSDNATYGFTRSPLAPNNKLMVGNNKVNEYGNAALYQLRLIKTQPTDIQLEVIKQQVLREHNDYIKEMEKLKWKFL